MSRESHLPVADADNSEESGASGRSAARLYRRYLYILGVAAALLLLNQALVQPPLLRLATDAPVINVAGRQRMLSQRLAKAALALRVAENDDQRRRRLAELRSVLEAWSQAHAGLRQGDAAMSLPGENSAAVRAAFDELEPAFHRMRAAAENLLDAYARSPRQIDQPADFAAILESEPVYLAQMDRIVGMYEREARSRAVWLRRTGWIVSALLLTALLVLGLVVLAPAARVLQTQMTQLSAARRDLEDRVRERTRELEHASQQKVLAEQRGRELVQQLGRAAHANTMGEMASGLAHELNQPLGAVANYLEGCLAALDSPQPPIGELRSALEKALATTLRAGEIIRRIRRFVRRGEIADEPIAPRELVESVCELLSDEARRRGVVLEKQLAPDLLDLPTVRGDPIQLQQVLTNLAQNALDALHDSQVKDSKVVIAVEPASSGETVFRVSDNGAGIPPEQRDHVFDAFFSTRAQGMGMGLAISRSIVEAHQGRIWMESEVGQGTTFYFTLPAAHADDGASSGSYRR